MQFGWNLIGFMESLSIVLPQDNGTVETGNHIPSKLLNSLVVRSPRGGVAPDEWKTLPPGGNWDRLGGFYRQSTIPLVSMDWLRNSTATTMHHWSLGGTPDEWRYLLVRSPLMAPHLSRGGIPISLLLPPVWSVALWSPTPPTPRSVIRWSLTTSNQQQQPMPPLSLAWKLVTVNYYKCDPVAWCVSLYRESVAIYALSSGVSS